MLIISSCSKVVCAFAWFEMGAEVANGVPLGVDRTLRLGAQQRLEFRKRGLDRFEIGTLGRQIAQLGTDVFNGFPDPGSLVGRQIVHHDDVAA